MGYCTRTGSANFGDEIRTVQVLLDDEEAPKNTDYQRFFEVSEEEANKLTGKDQEYSFPMVTDEMALYFFTPEAAKEILGKRAFEKALEHGYENSEKYAY